MMSLKRVLLGAVLTAAAIVLIGCPDGSLLDLFGGAAGPTPGDSGFISVDAIDQTTIDISWTAATDETTATPDIEYQVYYATSDSIGTPEDAAANGNAVFAAWTAAAVTATLNGLTRDTQYWIIVVARNADDDMSAYAAQIVSTAVGPVIRLEDDATRETIPEDGTAYYGTVHTFAPLTKQFNIWNYGDQVLVLSSDIPSRVVLAGDVGFSIVTQPPNEAILPGNKETFAIVFQSDGMDEDKYDTATIASNDPSGPFSFELTAYAGC